MTTQSAEELFDAYLSRYGKELSHRTEDTIRHTFLAGHASRDAEVAELRRLLAVALEALNQYVNVVTSHNKHDSWDTIVTDDGHYARNAIKQIKEAGK